MQTIPCPLYVGIFIVSWQQAIFKKNISTVNNWTVPSYQYSVHSYGGLHLSHLSPTNREEFLEQQGHDHTIKHYQLGSL